MLSVRFYYRWVTVHRWNGGVFVHSIILFSPLACCYPLGVGSEHLICRRVLSGVCVRASEPRKWPCRMLLADKLLDEGQSHGYYRTARI